MSRWFSKNIQRKKKHILALAAETGFLLFKELVPLKFKKLISAVQCERKAFQWILLSTPVNFRWTVPLSQPFRGESQTTRIGCPCKCCIVDICFILVVTVILIIVFYFEIHTFIIESVINYWNLQWS
jgi:hypothetical protein